MQPVDNTKHLSYYFTMNNTPARMGRPTIITPEIIDAVVRVVQTGVPWNFAAVTAGVSQRTIHGWMERGERETSRLADDPDAEPNEDEALYAEFHLRVDHAYQTAIQRNLLYLQQSARGGYVTEESERRNRDGSTEKTTKKTAPDWRAAAKFLQYASPRMFGDKPAQVEVSGPGGSAIQVEGMGSLAARLAARAIEDGNTVDGEVVEDDE